MSQPVKEIKIILSWNELSRASFGINAPRRFQVGPESRQKTPENLTHTARVATVTSQLGTAVHPAALTKLMTKISKCTKPNKMLNASISKHMQYPPNWATDSVCCTVKECDRSRVQHTPCLATVIATVISQLVTVVHPYKAYD